MSVAETLLLDSIFRRIPASEIVIQLPDGELMSLGVLIESVAFTDATFLAYFASLPTEEPEEVGRAWNNGGVLCVTQPG